LNVEVSPIEVTFVGRNLSVHALPGETLMSCIRRAGLAVESTCNGRGACGKCRVQAQGALSEPDDIERGHLNGLPQDVRLACMAQVMGDVRVILNDDWTRLQSVFGTAQVDTVLKSSVTRVELPASEPRSAQPYAETLTLRVADPRVLNAIVTRQPGAKKCCGVAFADELLDLCSPDEPLLGAAVDVGTTSLSLNLFDLETGALLGRSSALNPQTAYGGDVITRINYCRQGQEGVERLAAVLIEELGTMLDEALGPDLPRDRVYLMTVAANTTMLHLLARIQPLSLGLSPFRPAFLAPLLLSAGQCGLPMHPQGRCILLPGASAYVGADILAGLAAIGYNRLERPTLFIDIGTNGEMVLIEGPDRMLGASCAVGPALEGMNISCGCRAVPGAIDSFTLDEDLCPRFTTIGDQTPRGICGSGLVDLTAALFCSGAIAPSGAFNTHADERLKRHMKDGRFHLTESISFTQKDIRQVQLAKAAVVSGILTLLAESGRAIKDLEEIMIAGAFGYHLNPENLKLIGLVPKEFQGNLSYCGNSSLSGASLALLNRDVLSDMSRIRQRLRVVELATHPDFSDRFMSGLQF
jgi:uncharacterized 2Fe-2S/4Fe-4S cluster protein (DUF4445 family)